MSVSTVSNATIVEGGNLVHTVTMSTASDATRTFAFTLTDGTATSGDYGAATFSNGVTLSAGLITVPAGVTGFTVTIPITGDTLDESRRNDEPAVSAASQPRARSRTTTR